LKDLSIVNILETISHRLKEPAERSSNTVNDVDVNNNQEPPNNAEVIPSEE
jgi:hypothetical protein